MLVSDGGVTMTAFLEVRELCVTFRGRRADDVVRAVEGASFDLARGKTLGIVGESGAGKTTLGRAVLRLVEPEAGSVSFDGENVLALRGRGLAQFRERAQIVFQDPHGSLNPRMLAGEAVSEVLAVRGMSRIRQEQRVRELFDRVGLPAEVAGALPHQLSGGQQQRVGIARALATEPDFLVLDEPVSALDVSVQARIVNLLLDLQRDLALTYLFISHDLALVSRVSDRIVVMKDGGIVDEGAGLDALRQSNHPYTRTLITAALPGPSARAAGGG